MKAKRYICVKGVWIYIFSKESSYTILDNVIGDGTIGQPKPENEPTAC